MVSPRNVFRNDHPVCALEVASQHFLDGAATPPLRGGEYVFKYRIHFSPNVTLTFIASTSMEDLSLFPVSSRVS